MLPKTFTFSIWKQLHPLSLWTNPPPFMELECSSPLIRGLLQLPSLFSTLHLNPVLPYKLVSVKSFSDWNHLRVSHLIFLPLIKSPGQYAAANYEAHYAVFSSLLLLSLSCAQIFSSAPYYRTHLIHIRLKVFMVLSVHIAVFWLVTPCRIILAFRNSFPALYSGSEWVSMVVISSIFLFAAPIGPQAHNFMTKPCRNSCPKWGPFLFVLAFLVHPYYCSGSGYIRSTVPLDLSEYTSYNPPVQLTKSSPCRIRPRTSSCSY
jgi:hypothetical protein